MPDAPARKERANYEAFRAILTRQGGEPPRDGDDLLLPKKGQEETANNFGRTAGYLH